MTGLGGAADAPSVIARLRVAALLTLGALLALLLTELHYAEPAQYASIPALYGVYALVATAVLVATFTPSAARHAAPLAFAFSLGLVFAGLYALYAERAHPMVAATALFAALMLSLVFFAWSPLQMAVLSGVACLGFALVGLVTPPAQTVALPFAFAFASLIVGSAVAIASARVGGRLRADLAARERDLVRLSQQLMSVQEEERRRLSRELHDGVGQSLTAILSYLWLIEQQLPADATVLRTRTAEARRLAATTMAELRELSQLLRPSTLDDYGLVPSLRSHLRAFAERHQIVTTFDADGLPERLPAAIETAVYRITQEALTNVARHARATRVRVDIALAEGTLRLDIQDDGVGLRAASAARSDGGGLLGIRERVRSLGGRVLIRSERGTRLSIELPFAGSLPQTPESA
ncbi:MAG TPA: sensor histidine kinase [Candidatus Binatia bacterium]|nr:sensor histidine kinase [Candidatus Binatia bacterium]